MSIKFNYARLTIILAALGFLTTSCTGTKAQISAASGLSSNVTAPITNTTAPTLPLSLSDQTGGLASGTIGGTLPGLFSQPIPGSNGQTPSSLINSLNLPSGTAVGVAQVGMFMLGIGTVNSQTGVSPVQYQILLPQTVVFHPELAPNCLQSLSGFLPNGVGTACIEFTQPTVGPSVQAPFALPIQVSLSNSLSATIGVFVTPLPPTPANIQVNLKRTCTGGGTARPYPQTAYVQNSQYMVLAVEVAGLSKPLLVQPIIGHNFNTSPLYDPVTVDLTPLKSLPGWQNAPVQFNVCNDPGLTGCLNKPLSAMVSRGTETTISATIYNPVVVPAGTLAASSSVPSVVDVLLMSNSSADIGSQACDAHSPLILKFNKGLPKTGAVVNFDILNNGKPMQMDWLKDSGTAFLALPDAHGNIKSGGQLFGEATLLPSGDKPSIPWNNGFEALAQYAEHSARRITPDDSIWPKLRLWFANGKSEVLPGSIRTLDEMGVTELSLDYESSIIEVGYSSIRQESEFSFMRHHSELKSLFADIWFFIY